MKRRDAARRYFPLGALVAALLIAVYGLPSALNLPQANPSTVYEYAPVPASSDQTPPPGGNLASIGQGTTGTLGDAPPGDNGTGTGTGDSGSAPPPPPQPGNQGGNPPPKYHCVGNPPRQTEDPLSPPCVSNYTGNNGGSTFHGVTGQEISLVLYVACSSSNQYLSSQGVEVPTCGRVDDLGTNGTAPPNSFVLTRVLADFAKYFTARYATYNRLPHWRVVYGSPGTSNSPNPSNLPKCKADCRASDEANIDKNFSPFAMFTYAPTNAPNMDDFEIDAAQKKTVMFGGFSHFNSFYSQYPGQLWNYAPSIENQAALYASFICQKVVGRKVTNSQQGDNGKDRRLALLYDDQDPFFKSVADTVTSSVSGCKGSFADTKTFSGGSAAGGSPTDVQGLTQTFATFKTENITSVVVVGSTDGDLSRTANQTNFKPEWFTYGDGYDDWTAARYQDQTVWNHAVVMTRTTLHTRATDEPCAVALYEADPSFPGGDLRYCEDMYDDLRMMFTGIQVAGPNLTPQTMDQGYHAIPPGPSSSPKVPACYYPAGDYTCVKDAIVEYWDPNGQIPGWTGTGCFRIPSGGRRYLTGQWPPGDVTAQFNPAQDPCNTGPSSYTVPPAQQTG